MRASFRAACAAATILVTAVIGACEGDEILGPPDGAACTVGTVSPGDSVKSAVTLSSCAFWNDYDYEINLGESWTLDAKANTAYMVRVRHVDDAEGFDGIGPRIQAYSRNDQGDPVFATGTWYNFGPTNDNGFKHSEMFLATDVDRQFSIRIMISDTAYVGSYTLSVESCPLRRLDGGATFTGVNINAGCLSASYMNNGRNYRLAFFSYPADTLADFLLEGTRTAGNGTLIPQASGPDLDIGCYTADCIWYALSNYVTSFSIAPSVNIAGRMTFYVGVDADSTATIDLTGTPPVSPPAITAPSRARVTGTRQR